jgi:cytochrome c biogenesis protein CcmG/thiol:disulfide interchange protein DsbE
MRSNRLFILILIVAVGMTVYFSLSGQSLSKDQRPEIGFQAPSFSLDALDSDKTYGLESTNKPIVINFWASWCAPCREEAPDLVRLYDQYRDNLDVYAINLTNSDSMTNVERFVNEFGFEFPVLLDQEGDVGKTYQVLAIPTTFFIDENGTIVHKIVGFASSSDLEMHFRRLAGR